MSDDRELLAMAKEQGRLVGLVEGISNSVDDLKTDQRRLWGRLDEQSTDLHDIKGRLDVVIDTMKESGIRPAIPVIPLCEPKPESATLVVIKHPATPLAFALVVVLVIVILLTSALTGRNARDLLPAASRSDHQVKQ